MGLIAEMAERNFQAMFEAWHNQPCPEVEEVEISFVTHRLPFDALGYDMGRLAPPRRPGDDGFGTWDHE